jgi:hypothetical protein
MTQRLQPEPLLTSLVERDVAFIVVGGYAVAAHGYVRATKDIDICPDPDPENLQRLADALAELEAKPIGLDEFAGEFDLEPDLKGLQAGGNWALETRYGRLDVLQHIEGLGDDGGGWRELSSNTVVRNFLGHECLFCSYSDLIKMKQSAGRPQDEVDINSLKAARGEA